MADEIMTLEGISRAVRRAARKGKTMSASFIDGITDDLMDAKGWTRGAKAMGGGAAGRLLFPALKKIDWLATKAAAYPTGALIAQGLLGVLLGVATERYIGEAAASGFIGGASGDALARLANMGLAKLDSATTKVSVDLAGGVGDNALTPEERAFLRGLPSGVGEPAAETQSYLNEVAVEPETLQGLSEAEEAVLFSGG